MAGRILGAGDILSLVEQGHYNDTEFHPVIRGLVAQGGGGKARLDYSIPCECYRDDRRDHFVGSLSMANDGRDTGGSQFFINTKDNQMLDFRGRTLQGWGYAVFGKVIQGLEIVDQIEQVPTTSPLRLIHTCADAAATRTSSGRSKPPLPARP